MARRLDLQQELSELISPAKVYFEPPETMKLSYPCLVYSVSNIDIKHADNTPHVLNWRFQLTYITTDPDDPAVDKLSRLSAVRFDRSYRSGSLQHFVFQLYR